MCRNTHITACNWVFVLTLPLEWYHAVTFSEPFTPQGYSTRDFWICLHSARETEATIRTSHSCRALAVSEGSHWLFYSGEEQECSQSLFSSTQGKVKGRKSGKPLLNLVPSFPLEIVMIIMLPLTKCLWRTKYCAVKYTHTDSDAQRSLTSQVVSFTDELGSVSEVLRLGFKPGSNCL